MSFFKKILDKIIPPTDDRAQEQSIVLEKGDFTRDLDYRFAQEFTNGGGYFNYCADEKEALLTLKKIYEVEEITSTYCFDQNLISFLDVINASHTKNLSANNNAAFVTCEFLVAFNGRIILSYDNIEHYHSSKLPEVIIVIANISQIIDNQHDALAKVKRKGTYKNITSISGANSRLDNTVQQTKLFLLLLED